jgi:hypothetical protein
MTIMRWMNNCEGEGIRLTAAKRRKEEKGEQIVSDTQNNVPASDDHQTQGAQNERDRGFESHSKMSA